MTYPMRDFECEQEQKDIEALTEELMEQGRSYYPFSKLNFIEAMESISDADFALLQAATASGSNATLGFLVSSLTWRYWRPIARDAAEIQVVRNRQ